MTDSVPANAAAPKTLYYTFGNHMHWVDMEWLWGYFVLPSSVRDMLAFCAHGGIKGNVNFDAVGYEKLAVEAPDALAELRAAIASGTIEVVGGSYAQPYGQFHGGESNVRQRVYGARSIRRLLGVWPRTFWEEEFDFFPQLPQILARTGFEYASLFFQWTWHTPEIPRETIPVIWWQGLDGTKLLAASRNPLNLHQWPEEFALLLESDELNVMATPGIVQWLELMPSPDWMCRSELMIPALDRLLADPRFTVIPVTLSEYLEQAKSSAEVRRYTLDQVFHGLSLGKNGDLFRQLSADAEHAALAAETISVLAGFAGRPYPSWDVYPTWELEEAWRELMIGQHHDNDECEGLNGHIGRFSYERSLSLTRHIIDRTMRRFGGQRTDGDGVFVFNPLGWERDVPVGPGGVLRKVPAFSLSVVAAADVEATKPIIVEQSRDRITLRRRDFSVEIDPKAGVIRQITSKLFPQGALPNGLMLGRMTYLLDGSTETFTVSQVDVLASDLDAQYPVTIGLESSQGAAATIALGIAPERDAVDMRLAVTNLPWIDPGFAGALTWQLGANLDEYELRHDHPYGISEISAPNSFVRKYPTGDWMTSLQYFETVERPFSALQFLDFTNDERGVLFVTGSHQSFQRNGDTVTQIIDLRDPWDGDYFVDRTQLDLRIVPHGPMKNSERWKVAQETLRPAFAGSALSASDNKRTQLIPFEIKGEGVVATALYRETPEAGQHVPNYAGAGMDYPVVLRLVELDGKVTTVTIATVGQLGGARQTNLLGETMRELQIESGNWRSTIEIALQPYEIATLYLDPLKARKQIRDLDAKREVWATIHRTQA